MVKTKVISIAALLLGAAISLSAQGYQWRRVAMDGSRTGADAQLSRTAKLEQKLLDSCQDDMAYLKEVVGYCPDGLLKYGPQSPLSNWFADAIITQTSKIKGEKCDVSIANFGGIRVDMPKGNVIVDDIRSMFPFKNDIVIVKTKGERLWEILSDMASTRRWQVLGGFTIVAGEDGLESVLIGGETLQMDKVYSLVTNTFLLNGGDGLFLAKGAESCESLGMDVYTVVMAYLEDLKAAGGVIDAKVDGRLTIPARRSVGRHGDESNIPTVNENLPHVEKPRLTIIHTNDTHSHMEPVRAGKSADMAGVVERAAYIDSVRTADGARNVLLVDAGDFSQGTPYFTIFGGTVEVEALNRMKYDVTTLGNHEWDNGVDALADRLAKAKFDVVLTNYSFTNTRINKYIKPYVIIRRGGLKIGVLGVLTDVTTVVANTVASQMTYSNPIESINRWSSYLKDEKGCDYVIVLSHCGISDKDTNPGDVQIAAGVHDVDVIIGGHSHTDLKAPLYINDADGRPVMIVTDYCWGIYAGELKL